jgi:hypothetical protein
MYVFRGGFPHAPRPRCGLLYVPCQFQIRRHALAAMVLFAPPTSDQWYLLLAPFILPLADGTELPPPAGGTGDYYLDEYCPVILLRGPFGA